MPFCVSVCVVFLSFSLAFNCGLFISVCAQANGALKISTRLFEINNNHKRGGGNIDWGWKNWFARSPKCLSPIFYDVVVVVVGQPPLCLEIKSFFFTKIEKPEIYCHIHTQRTRIMRTTFHGRWNVLERRPWVKTKKPKSERLSSSSPSSPRSSRLCSGPW